MTERGEGERKRKKEGKESKVPADSVVGENQPYSDFLSFVVATSDRV